MATPSFEILELLKNENAKVTVATGGAPVTAFVQSDLIINGSNNFTNSLQSSNIESLQVLLQKGQGIAQAMGATHGSQFSARTLSQSTDFWTGSERPTFTIDMLFVALYEEDDVRKKVMELYRCTYPTAKGLVLTETLIPPLGYQPDATGVNATGTITVKYGKWFRAPGQLMKNVSFKFSKEVLKSGLPVFAVGSITFHPFREISFSEFQKYLLAG